MTAGGPRRDLISATPFERSRRPAAHSPSIAKTFVDNSQDDAERWFDRFPSIDRCTTMKDLLQHFGIGDEPFSGSDQCGCAAPTRYIRTLELMKINSGNLVRSRPAWYQYRPWEMRNSLLP